MDEMDKFFCKTFSTTTFIGGGIINCIIKDDHVRRLTNIQHAKHFVKGGLVGNAIFVGGVMCFKGYGKIFEKLGL